MTGKICVRAVGALACVALAATGWDAEAGWRRHHRHASCCYETVCDPCCAPACEPVCVSSCAPVCVTRVVEPSCCYRTEWVSTVVQERVIVPTSSCCDGRVVAREASPSATPGITASATGGEGHSEGAASTVAAPSSRLASVLSR